MALAGERVEHAKVRDERDALQKELEEIAEELAAEKVRRVAAENKARRFMGFKEQINTMAK